MRRTLLLLSLAVLSSCNSTEPTARREVIPNFTDAATVAARYRELNLLTPQEVYVDPVFAAYCIQIPAEAVKKAEATAGPHALTAVKIYANDRAATAFKQNATEFPVGSVIVKEKHGYQGRERRNVDRGHDGVGGMIKREPGYDAANGDWEYFYFEDPAKIDSGKIVSCIDCHQRAALRDHVFGGWRAKSDGVTRD